MCSRYSSPKPHCGTENKNSHADHAESPPACTLPLVKPHHNNDVAICFKRGSIQINKLIIRGDSCSNEATFFNIDGNIIEPSTCHTFGSPCFVLDDRLQSRLSTLAKWDLRSRIGIYVSHSPSHSGTVALILNHSTGHMSPQYHVVFGNHFTTVPFMNKNNTPTNWASLVENSRECITEEEEYKLAQEWLSPEPTPNSDNVLTSLVPCVHIYP